MGVHCDSVRAVTGAEYAGLVAQYIVRNYSARGVDVYREVFLGKTIIGKNRRVDVLIVHAASRVAMALECKYQDSTGTADEKLPYALEDLRSIGIPVSITYAGRGFSPGILHLLEASPIAALCLPGKDLAPSIATRELDVALALAFKWWDVIVRNKTPITLADTTRAPSDAADADDDAQLKLGAVDE